MRQMRKHKVYFAFILGGLTLVTLAYPLSLGPASWLVDRGWVRAETVNALFGPLRSCTDGTPLGDLAISYQRLWSKRTFTDGTSWGLSHGTIAFYTSPKPLPLVESDVAVPMRDGTILRADVCRPDGPGPFPVLVLRTPYGRPKKFDAYTKAGYIVVSQDARGRYA